MNQVREGRRKTEGKEEEEVEERWENKANSGEEERETRKEAESKLKEHYQIGRKISEN